MATIAEMLGDACGKTTMLKATDFVPQINTTNDSVIAIAERECENLTRTSEAMQQRFAAQGDYATALIIQQQIVGVRLMRDAIQSAFKSR